MSLLDQIQQKMKVLSKSSTIITTITGDKFVETTDTRGKKTQTKLDEKHAGYVIDTHPDLQVAEILPYLAFGSQDVVVDRDLLLSFNITHILSLGVKPPVEFSEFSYKFINLLDVPEENLLAILPVTNDLIKAVSKDGRSKAFVHCSAGCSRAPSIVIGYLIYEQKLSFLDAYNSIRSVRYIRPNEGFTAQLNSYERALNVH